VTPVALDLIGLGGVVEADDARDLLVAGAVAVAVGTATFRDPGTVRRIAAALAADAAASRSGAAPPACATSSS
jgi:dihydroorotate dehydrogenase (NAD+) catalytic subunit